MDAGEPEGAGGASLLLELYQSAERGELQKVASWLSEGGPIDAVCSWSLDDGQSVTATLLHAAAAIMSMQVDVSLHGHPSIVRLLLSQHSSNLDLQSSDARNALTMAAQQGYEACVQALLRAKANEIMMVDVQGEVQKMSVRGEVQKAEVARHDFLQRVEARAKAEAEATKAEAMN